MSNDITLFLQRVNKRHKSQKFKIRNPGNGDILGRPNPSPFGHGDALRRLK